MAKPFHIGFQITVLDNTGVIQPGAQIFTYQAGTTTPLSVYPTITDASNGTNAFSNPIVADSAGRCPDLYATQAVKVIAAPSTDSTPPSSAYWTVDNYTGVNNPVSVVDLTSTYTVLPTDRDKLFECDASVAPFTINLLSVSVAGMGYIIEFKKIDSTANAITIQGNGSDIIDNSNTLVMNTFNAYVRLICDGTKWVSTLIQTIPTNSLTYSKIQQETASTLLGNPTGVLANVQEITLSTALAFTASVLGIATNGITYGDIQQASTVTLLGNPTGALANVEEITLSAALVFTGTVLGLAANEVLYSNIQQLTAVSLVGNPTGALANVEAITLGTSLNFSGTTLNITPAAASDQRTGTSTALAVTPSTQQFHQSAAKAWGNITGTTINKGFNIASATNPSTGSYTVAFTSGFTDGAYCVLVSAAHATQPLVAQVTATSTSGFAFAVNTIASPPVSFAATEINFVVYTLS